MNTCRHGHPWTPENTYVRANGKHRTCRACNRERRSRTNESVPKTGQAPVPYALARIRAERDLVAAHCQEALELRRERGYAPGIIELVARHREEHRELYRAATLRLGGLAGGDPHSLAWTQWRPGSIARREQAV